MIYCYYYIVCDSLYFIFLLQIMDLREIVHVSELRMLRVLNLKHNPVEVQWFVYTSFAMIMISLRV